MNSKCSFAYVWLLTTLVITSSIAGNNKPMSHDLHYYERPNWPAGQKVAGILCITNGVALKGNKSKELAGVVGHTSVSFFDTVGDEERRTMVARKVTSYSTIPSPHWPFGKKESRGEYNLVKNYRVDHFLAMQSSTMFGSQNARHCIQVSSAEKTKFDDFIRSKENSKWSFRYNCGDFAMEAFMGILYPDKKIKELKKIVGISNPLITTPRNIFDAITHYQKNFKIKGTLTYAPGKEDIPVLEKLAEQKSFKITTSIFEGVPAAAEIPTISESTQSSKTPKHFRNR